MARWLTVLLAMLLGAAPVAALTGQGDSSLFALNTLASSAAAPDLPAAAADFVGPCTPNPFNPQTVVPFGVARRGPVRLTVYDVQGRAVRVLVDEGDFASGAGRATWDGRDEQGQQVASGVYFARLRTLDRILIVPMVLVR
jgi:hypothetical protein